MWIKETIVCGDDKKTGKIGAKVAAIKAEKKSNDVNSIKDNEDCVNKESNYVAEEYLPHTYDKIHPTPPNFFQTIFPPDINKNFA